MGARAILEVIHSYRGGAQHTADEDKQKQWPLPPRIANPPVQNWESCSRRGWSLPSLSYCLPWGSPVERDNATQQGRQRGLTPRAARIRKNHDEKRDHFILLLNADRKSFLKHITKITRGSISYPITKEWAHTQQINKWIGHKSNIIQPQMVQLPKARKDVFFLDDTRCDWESTRGKTT